MRKLLNPWGPWNDNPSKYENFYKKIDESKVVDVPILNNDDIIEDLKEQKKESKIEETSLKIKESVDPYVNILKDLK